MNKRHLLLVGTVALSLAGYEGNRLSFAADAGTTAAVAPAPAKRWSASAGLTTNLDLGGASDINNAFTGKAGYEVLSGTTANLTVPVQSYIKKSGSDKKSVEFDSGAVTVGVARKKLYTVEAADVTLGGGASLNLPNKDRYTVAKLSLKAAKKLGKLDLSYGVAPAYHFQKYTTSEKGKATTQAACANSLGVSYGVTDKLSLSAGSSLSSSLSHKTDKEERKLSHKVGLDAGCSYEVAKKISLAAGLSSEAPTTKYAVTKNTSSANVGVTVTF